MQKPDDFRDELLGHNSRKIKPFDTDPATEIVPAQPKFNWTAFFVMLVTISVALLVGVFIPGPFDEAVMIIIIAAINGFMSAHGFSIKNFLGRK